MNSAFDMAKLLPWQERIERQKERLDRCPWLSLFYGDQGLFAAFALFTGSLDLFSLWIRGAGADRRAFGNGTTGRLWMSSKVCLHPFIVVHLLFALVCLLFAFIRCGGFLSGVRPCSW